MVSRIANQVQNIEEQLVAIKGQQIDDKANFVDLYQTLVQEHKKLKQKVDVKLVQQMGQDMRSPSRFAKTSINQENGGDLPSNVGVAAANGPDSEARFRLLEEQMLQIRSGNNDYQAHIHSVMKSQNEHITRMDNKLEQLYNFERFPENVESRMSAKFGDLFNQELKKNAYHAQKSLDQLNFHVKIYFKDWLDSNAMGMFHQEINDVKSLRQLHDDWVNFINLCSQMKYYSITLILSMVEILKEKWLLEPSTPDDEEEDPLALFVQFKHTSPYVVQILERINLIVDKTKRHDLDMEVNKEYRMLNFEKDEMDLLTKLSIVLEFFSYNQTN